MKKLLVFFVLITGVLFNSSANAQFIKKPSVLIGGSLVYAAPKNDFSKMYKNGFGAEASGGLGVGSTYLQATVGITRFPAKQNYEVKDITYMPLKIGIKQYFLLKKVFVNGDVGLGTIKDATGSSSRFTRGIGGGVRLFGLEGAVYYDGWKNEGSDGFSNSVLFKLGYVLRL